MHCFSTQQAKFEIYDLQYECQYLIRVNAVSQAGNLGKTSKTKLNTPVCEKILVKGNSLSPDCPHRGKELFLYPTWTNLKKDIYIGWRGGMGGYIGIILSILPAVQMSCMRNSCLSDEILYWWNYTQSQYITLGCTWLRIIPVWTRSREIINSVRPGCIPL